MKSLIIFFVSFFLLFQNPILSSVSAQEREQGTATITIIDIKSDDVIEGKVSGLNPSQYERLKVLVYVHTDKWYIHPYKAGGEGKSYAKINQDGTWKIKTVRREFPADNVAVFVVDKDYKPPAEVVIENIEVVFKEAKAKLIQAEEKERL